MKVKKTAKTTIKKKNKKGSTKSEEPEVKVLKQSGYQGESEEEIVDRWFQTLCQTIGNEQGLDVNASGHVKMTRRDDGKTEVS